MATVSYSLSTKVDKELKKSEILIRFTYGNGLALRSKSGVYVPQIRWNEKDKCLIIPRLKTPEQEELTIAQKHLDNLKNRILELFLQADKEAIAKQWLDEVIDRYHFPDKYSVSPEDAKVSFFGTFDTFLQKRKLSDVREKNFLVLKRALQRYEMFVGLHEKRIFLLDLETITAETIEDFESFLRNEHTLYEEYKDMYKCFPATTGSNRKTNKPQPRGHNTICALFHKLRAFFNWCNDQGITTNRPFVKYDGNTTEKYGRPVYITLDERNQIADHDLSGTPHLEVQRDIFIFQCLIGCRVSDLMRLKPSNVINGAIQYIPHKTKDGRPLVVEVPLNERAKTLVTKYKGVDEEGRLFPFISSQNYNYAIKDVFKACKIDRVVTVINPKTGDEEQLPIHDVASSHMARRTFVGNLYKQVKDPNLVGSLSGHKEGSRAFARYRDIDRDMKNELVKMME